MIRDEVQIRAEKAYAIKKAVKEAIKEKAESTARNMKKDGVPINLIEKYTGLSEAAIAVL